MGVRFLGGNVNDNNNEEDEEEDNDNDDDKEKEEDDKDNKDKNDDTIPSLHYCVGHTAWAPEGREGRYQAGPKGRNLEVGAQRAPTLSLVDF